MEIGKGYDNTIGCTIVVSVSAVIVRECGQTLGLGLVDRNRTVGNY